MDPNISSLLIGIMVMLAIFLSLSRVTNITNSSVRKALAIFAGAAAVLSTLWLRSQPDLLEEYVQQIVLAALGLLVAFLLFTRKSLQ